MFRRAFTLAASAFSSRAVLNVVKNPAFYSGARKVAFATTALGFATYGLSKFSPAESFIAQCDDKIPIHGVPGTKNERTFIAVKPDGTQRGLIGKIISRFEEKGYKLVAIKIIHPTEELARQHYDDLKAKPFFPGLVKFFSSGGVVAMVWEGKNAIKAGRKLLGATDPQASEPGTIRGDFCIEVGRNIVHGSDGPDSAKDEITLWFKENEIAEWQRSVEGWIHEK